jgi:hypothetical protein
MVKFTRKDFLETIFQEYFRRHPGFIMVSSRKHLEKKTQVRFFPNIEMLARESYSSDQHVFFSVCPHESMKPEKGSIRYLVALWAGLDLGPEGYSGKQLYFFGQPQAAKAVRSFPLPPSIIVESGWGLHLYWLLREITPIEDVSAVENILGKINSYFQCKTPVSMDTMLRLPDTTNCKVGSHVVDCKVKYINQDFRYDLEDFEKTPLVVIEQDRPKAALGPEPDMSSEMEVFHDEQLEENYLPALPVDKEASTPVFEPVPYEHEPAAAKPSPPVKRPPIDMADEIANKVVERLYDKFMDQLANEIADRVIKRITSGR